MCVVEIEGVQVNLPATLEESHDHTHTFTCSPHQVLPPFPVQCADADVLKLTSTILTSVCLQFQYAVSQLQYLAPVYLRRGDRRIDASPGLRRKECVCVYHYECVCVLIFLPSW